MTTNYQFKGTSRTWQHSRPSDLKTYGKDKLIAITTELSKNVDRLTNENTANRNRIGQLENTNLRFVNMNQQINSLTEEFKNIKTKIHSNHFNTVALKGCLEEQCVICLEPQTEIKNIALLNCGHSYHIDCLKNCIIFDEDNCCVCRVVYDKTQIITEDRINFTILDSYSDSYSDTDTDSESDLDI